MREGVLWFDNSEQRDTAAKIERGMKYAAGKLEQQPTYVYIHPAMTLDGPVRVDGIEVRLTKSVLPNHFWFTTAALEAKA